MQMTKQKNRAVSADLVRRVILAWLLAVTVEFSLLPSQMRDLNGLEALAQMSSVRVLCLMFVNFVLLLLVSRFAETKCFERWLMAGTFAVLMTVSPYDSFSPAFLGITLLCLLLFLVYFWKGQAPKSETPTPMEQKRRPALCLTAVAALVFFLFVSLWTVCRVLTYRAPTYDLGIFSQMFHQMRTTGLPTTTLERDGLLSHFDVHVSPIYYLLLPFYFLWQLLLR